MPLSIFTIPETAKVAVMEMGISKPGEMTRLTEIVAPDIAVITNVASSHLEYLGSVDGVAKEKLEMVRLASPNAPVIVNADDPVLMRHVKTYRSHPVTFGFSQEAMIHPDSFEILSDGSSKLVIDGHDFHVPLLGRHYAYNLLTAYAVAKTLGYSFENVDTKSIQFSTAPMRGQSIYVNGITFIADCYNSNPQSLKAGLEAFAVVKTSHRKILIIGDMLELGEEETRFHTEIGASLGSFDCDAAIFVGYDAASCASAMKQFLKADDVVYLKASRGIGLEAVLKAFESGGGKQ
jgi:UDP-N-acetylmuramoyl-tripeptide--D-alanyl-D-alanine ligase